MSVGLDAFALPAWLQDGPRADFTERFLSQAASDQGSQCFVSAIDVDEVYYRLIAYEGPKKPGHFGKKLGKGSSP